MGTHSKCAHTAPDGTLHIAVRAPTTHDWNTQHQAGIHDPIYTCTFLDRHSQHQRGTNNPQNRTHNSRQAHTNPSRACTAPAGHTEPRTGTHNPRSRCTVPHIDAQPQTGTPRGWAPLTLQSIPLPCALEQWSEPCPGAVVQHSQRLLLAVTYEQGPF